LGAGFISCSSAMGVLRNHALRIAIDGALAVFKRIHRGQEIRHLHSGVQQVNKISWGDALTLGYVEQFNDSALYQFRLGLCGLSNTIHCTSLGTLFIIVASIISIQRVCRIALILSVQKCTRLPWLILPGMNEDPMR
jgi:hypothetical protein